jgi:DNA-binding SARP family transcriptional activator
VLSLVTLGSLRLTGDSAPLLAGRRKVLAVLAYLARRATHDVPRAELTALFWPDRDEVHAKQSLRQVIAELRPLLETLQATPEAITLGEGELVLDATLFEEAIRAERWSDAAKVWTGDFLVGAESLGGPAWQAWLASERASMRAHAARAFEQLVAVAHAAADSRAMLEAIARWCEVAPLDERAWTQRIETLVSSGRPVDAASCYESYLRRVRAAGGEPSSTFLRLRERFAATGAAARRRTTVPGPLTLSALTQLPLEARSLLEAAAVLGEPVAEGRLMTVSELGPHAFRAAVATLLRDGILRPSTETPPRYDFADPEERRLVSSVIAADRRRGLQRAVASHLGPAEPGPAKTEPAVPKKARHALPFRVPLLSRWTAAAGAVVLAVLTIPNWIERAARANALELAPGSTILLADVETGDSALGRALGTAAAVGLQQSRHVAVVRDPRLRVGGGAPAKSTRRRLDVQTARGIAVRDSVTRVVSLGVQRSDSTYRLAARVIDPRSGEVLREEQVEVGRTALVDGLDGLLQRVREALGESQSTVRDSSRPLRAVASPSLEALERYTQGARANAAGNADAARDAWLRALALDSSFALAELALADDAFARGVADEGEKWLERAITHADRLTTVEALRARHVKAWRDGDLPGATAFARELIAMEPSAEAWFALAQASLQTGGCADAATALASALALDSLHAPSHLARARCAAEQGDVEAAIAHHLAVQRADSLVAGSRSYLLEWGMLLTRAGRQADAESAFHRAHTARGTADSLQAIRALAALEMLRGRYGAGIPHLQHVAHALRSGTDSSALRLALLTEAEAFLAMGGRTRASELIDEVFALAASGGRPAEYFHLGRLMTRIGRVNGAREALRHLSTRLTPSDPADAWAERLLTAYLRLAERSPAEALAALGEDPAPASLEPFRLTVVAEAAAMTGEYARAEAAARRLADGWHFATAAQDAWMRALLRLARLAEARGDTAAARRAYQRYIDRWKDADVYLTELLSARRAAARLGGEVVTIGR